MQIHRSITIEAVMAAIGRQQTGLNDPGFCTSCGAEVESCEPDARGNECESCGESSVYGAGELLFMIAA